MPGGQNIALALSIAARLTAAAHRAMQQDRDVTDEELDAAMSRADEAHSRVRDLAEKDGIGGGEDNG
ncbi:MAG: hypothetical protein V5A84_00815 [Planctomycetota bacterium]